MTTKNQSTSISGNTTQQRTLFRGAFVVTQDPELGEMRGDLLVEGGLIKAVGASLEATGAEVIDASEFVILPGFIDTHRHTWQTSLRGLAAGATLEQYQHLIQGRFGRLFTPEDVYAGNLLGAVSAAQSGITTLCDESHVQNSPSHTDAAVRALKDSGSRAVFDYGWPSIDAPKWMNNSSLTHPTYVAELQKSAFTEPDALVTLRMMLRGPLMTPIEVTKHDLAFARSLGLRSAMHIIGGNIAQLDKNRLLASDLMFIHCCDSSDEEIAAVAEAGASISSSPNLELNMSGFGKTPPIRRFLAAGIRTSLSIDVETSVSGDMFSVMRAALSTQTLDDLQMQVGHDQWPRLTPRDVLGFATIDGARACGLDDRVGSITPGKQADLLMVRMSDANLAPVEPTSIVAQIVTSGHPGNVDSVMVSGRFIRRNGKATNSVAVDRAVELSRESRARLMRTAQLATTA
ncbi:MAG: amidohydrolase family protein [Pirellulaceae bacterium]